MGMTPHDFYYSYLHEILLAIDGFFELERQRHLADWERARMISFFAVKPHDAKKRIKKPSSLFELESDKIQRRKNASGFDEKIKKDLAIQQKRIDKWKEKGLLKN